MLLITTSRKPSRNTRAFARTLANLIPHSQYLTRGNKNIQSLIEEARVRGFEKILIIHDKNGNPSALSFIRVTRKDWEWEEEIVLKGIFFERTKKKFTQADADEFTSKLFNILPEESELLIKKEDNVIIIKNDEKKLMKMKIKEEGKK